MKKENTENSKKHNQKKLLIVLLVTAVVILAFGFIFVINKNENKATQKTSKQLHDFLKEEYDCDKYVKNFSDQNMEKPEDQALVLETYVGCAKEVGQYDKALDALEELRHLYLENTKLRKVININEEKSTIDFMKKEGIEAKKRSPESFSSPNPTKQEDGTYGGP